MARHLLTRTSIASFSSTRKYAVGSSHRPGSFQGISAYVSRLEPSPSGTAWVRNRKMVAAYAQTRFMHSTPHHSALSVKSHPPKNRDRGPPSKEDTQTDFAAMNMLGSMAPPSTAVDACLDDGFALDSGLKVTGAGVLLVGGEAFKWRPWVRGDAAESVGGGGGKLKNAKGMFEVDKSVWGVLDLVWPKPDLLILGTGERIVPVSPQTRRDIAALGIRIEVQDTRNAAAQFNMLATERGTQQVAAALVPVGWRE